MFPSRIHVGTIRGIPVTLEPFAIIVLAFLFIRVVSNVLVGVVVVLLAALSILLHELGHAAAARLFGIRTLEIRLHVLGGWAAFEEPADTPLKEVVIALAGPAVNFAIWALTIGPLGLLDSLEESPLVLALALVGSWNLMLGILNSLPVVPLDGGWAFLGVVWGVTRKHDVAQRVAGTVGLVALGAYLVWRVSTSGGSPGGLIFPVLIALYTAPTCLAFMRGEGPAEPARSVRRQGPKDEARAEVGDTLARARTYASQLGHSDAGTAEVLLAVLAYESSVATQVMKSAGLDLDTVWAKTRQLFPPSPGLGPDAEAGLADAAAALGRTAEKSGTGRSGLFLAMGTESDAGRVVAALGGDIAALQAKVADLVVPQ